MKISEEWMAINYWFIVEITKQSTLMSQSVLRLLHEAVLLCVVNFTLLLTSAVVPSAHVTSVHWLPSSLYMTRYLVIRWSQSPRPCVMTPVMYSFLLKSTCIHGEGSIFSNFGHQDSAVPPKKQQFQRYVKL